MRREPKNYIKKYITKERYQAREPDLELKFKLKNGFTYVLAIALKNTDDSSWLIKAKQIY